MTQVQIQRQAFPLSTSMSRFLCGCMGVCSSSLRVFGGTGYVPVFSPQALVPRQVRGVASWAGHCNEAHPDLIIIKHL